MSLALTTPGEVIDRRIYIIRDQRVMLDRDLAGLYGVKAIALRQQVKRNLDRFPEDFLFQLTAEETKLLVSQNVIADRRSLGRLQTLCFHRTRGSDAIVGPHQQTRSSGEHRDHARFRPSP
jgi:hypothetical protein